MSQEKYIHYPLPEVPAQKANLTGALYRLPLGQAMRKPWTLFSELAEPTRGPRPEAGGTLLRPLTGGPGPPRLRRLMGASLPEVPAGRWSSPTDSAGDTLTEPPSFPDSLSGLTFLVV